MLTLLAMYGTDQFPKFKKDVYQVNGEDMTLIPTAEVPLTNYYRWRRYSGRRIASLRYSLDTIASVQKLGPLGEIPVGLIRMHQFNKVEMVKYTKPDQIHGMNWTR